MIALRVRKFGNSLGFVLPKEVLDALQAGEGDRLLLIETGDGDYRLSRYEAGLRKKMNKANKIMSRYRNTLRALSK